MTASSFFVRLQGGICVLFLSFFVSTACTPLKQYRTVTVVPKDGAAKDGAQIVDRVCEIQGQGNHPTNCALEHRRYQYPDGNGEMETRDYYLAFVEFDDQGWFWDRRQMEMLMRFVHDSEDELLIFAHVHGWQHNASACDNNVVCFQRFLERMDLGERAYSTQPSGGQEKGEVEDQPWKPRKSRKILGVYMGWRGKSGKIPKFNATTFWTRKGVARLVGVGGVTETLARLDDLRSFRNPGRTSDKTQLIISGHSFGGQVIYKALGQSLVERASFMGNVETSCSDRAEGQPPIFQHCVAKSFGDLVVLVNPAFEASAYQALHTASTNRCYPKKQRPSMMVITSTADRATKTAFPLGRSLSSVAVKARSDLRQKETVLKTVGHFEPFRTHDLRVPDGVIVDKPTVRDDGECGCPYLVPTAEFKTSEAEKQLFDAMKNQPAIGAAAATALSIEEFDRIEYGPDMELVRSKDYAANYPYLMIRTNDDFVPSHSQIYGERFTHFLRRFYFRHIVHKTDIPVECFKDPAESCIPTPSTPCERSWKGSLAKD